MIIVDASMLAYRCWSKMDFLENSKGVSTGLEFGFLRGLESLSKKWPEQDVVVVFDSHHHKRRVNPNYKANREGWDKSFVVRFNILKRFLQATYRTAAAPGYEADDVMIDIARNEPGPHVVYTNDDDLLITVDDERDVVVAKSFRSKLFIWDEAKVREKYGIKPAYLPSLRAFLGDKSDNLIGIGTLGRINRRYLATLIEWYLDAYGYDGGLLDEILTGDWSDKERDILKRFIDGGCWYDNNSVMVPWEVRPMWTRPGHDEDYVVEKLNEWEIRTLKLCEAYADRLADDLGDGEF